MKELFEEINGCYILKVPFSYFSQRYRKTISCPAGYISDGATGAYDVDSAAWLVHDRVCERGTWDDGSIITNWEASTVLSDLLKADGYWLRAIYWWPATWLFGGGAARVNGMFKKKIDE